MLSDRELNGLKFAVAIESSGSPGRLQSSIRNQLSSRLSLFPRNNVDGCHNYDDDRRPLSLRGLELSPPKINPLVHLKPLLTPYASFITAIDISHCKLSNSSLYVLCRSLPNLINMSAVESNLHDAEFHEIDLPSKLSYLNLSRNMLTKFPPGIASLIYLSSLNLSGNSISTVDTKILELPLLCRLSLLNNPVSNIPKNICRQGVSAMQSYFRVIPLALPQDEEIAKKHCCKRQLQCLKSISTDSDYSTDTISSVSTSRSQSPNQLFDWLCPSICPEGYSNSFQNSCCRVLLPENTVDSVTVTVVQDISLHPKLKSNEMLVTPVVSVEPHGYTFPSSQPAMIVLPHCTLVKPLYSFIPLCSNTTTNEPTDWQEDVSILHEVHKDCIIIYTPHFSLFSAISKFSYPSTEDLVQPEYGGILTIDDLPSFQLSIPRNCISYPMWFKATAYFSDSRYHSIADMNESLASSCILLEPHGIEFDPPVQVVLPIPNANQILTHFPEAKIKLYSASDSDDIEWNLLEVDIHLSNDVASFFVHHFSLFKLVWNLSIRSLNGIKMGASYAYQYWRPQYVFIRSQVFMSPPSPNTLTFPLLITVFKFGDPMKEPCNYRWLLADTGKKKYVVKTGEVVFHLEGYCFQQIKGDSQTQRVATTFKGEDFCLQLEAEYMLKLYEIELPISDYQVLGKLSVVQCDERLFEKLLIKVG